ncbi:MAG: protein kinase [Planctomycetota bacterium]
MNTDPNSAGGSGPPSSQGPDPIIGKEIDGCTIVKKIGQGGMGIVFLAEHSKLRQQYVVKILNPALTAAEDTVQRFFREAQSVARLNHPSIVGIQNVGQEREYYYIRMEYVDGDTVENIVKEKKKLEWKLATNIILETAEALSHAHKKGTIHRDIKPENIMLTKAGEVKVMDFGLAKQVQAATKVSVTGQIVGTPFFMSPEQAGGKTVDARSDIYSLGVSYYYLLTGVKPFNGKNLQEIFLKHFFYTPESPKIYTPDLPENVCEIIRRCLKKKKKERYQSASQLAKDLRAILEGGELSAAESHDGSEAGVGSSPSSVDMAPGPGTSDPGTTSRGYIASASDPAIPAASSDPVSRDLAAAQAEIGAGEPGTIVSTKGASPQNGSATIIAKALESGDQPAPSGEDAAAPLTKRNRVSLANAAGASLVFQPGGAPFQQKPQTGKLQPQRVQAEPGSDTSVTTEAPPSGEPEMPQLSPDVANAPVDGRSTLRIDPNKKAATTVVAPPERDTKKAFKLGAIAGGCVLLVVVYQVIGMAKFSSLEDGFAKAQAIHPPDNDLDGWKKLKADWDRLADGYEKFGSTFALTPNGGSAPARAEKCREGAKTAETSRATAETLAAEDAAAKAETEKMLHNKEQYRKEFADLLQLVKSLTAQKKFDEATKAAERAHSIATNLRERVQDVRVPVEVTCDIAAKVYAGTEELGELSPRKALAVLVPFKDKNFKLEVRRPKFKTWRHDPMITGHMRLRAVLDREITGRFALGKTESMRRFKLGVATEPLVAVGMAMDTQQPPSLDVVCQDGTLRSYELRNGRLRWNKHQQVGEYGDRLPPPEVLAGKAIVIAAPDGTIAAHDVIVGNVVSKANLGSPFLASPRIDATAQYIVAGTLGGDIVCLDLVPLGKGTANIKWRVSTDASILTQPLIQGNRVVVGSLDDLLRAIDMDTGKVVATYDAREAICAGPVAPGDVIYIGTREGRVHAVTISKNNEAKASFVTAPAGAEILQIFASGKGVYYSTKNDVRSADASGNKMFPPFTPNDGGVPLEVAGFVPMHDAIAVVTLNGFVFSVDATTGEEKWKLDLKTAIKVPPIFDGDNLHIATAEGEIVTIGGD